MELGEYISSEENMLTVPAGVLHLQSKNGSTNSMRTSKLLSSLPCYLCTTGKVLHEDEVARRWRVALGQERVKIVLPLALTIGLEIRTRPQL